MKKAGFYCLFPWVPRTGSGRPPIKHDRKVTFSATASVVGHVQSFVVLRVVSMVTFASSTIVGLEYVRYGERREILVLGHPRDCRARNLALGAYKCTTLRRPRSTRGTDKTLGPCRRGNAIQCLTVCVVTNGRAAYVLGYRDSVPFAGLVRTRR